jgi:hypothetical protein
MDKGLWYLLLQIEGLASHVGRLSGVGGPVRSLLWRNVDLASAGSGKDADKTHWAGGITCHVTLTSLLEPPAHVVPDQHANLPCWQPWIKLIKSTQHTVPSLSSPCRSGQTTERGPLTHGWCCSGKLVAVRCMLSIGQH